MTVPKVVLGREFKQLGQKRILVLRSFKLYRVYKVKFLSRYFIYFRSTCLTLMYPVNFPGAEFLGTKSHNGPSFGMALKVIIKYL